MKDFYGNGYYKFYPLWIGISLLLYWIAYASIIENNIYNDRKEIRKTRKECFKKKPIQSLSKDKFKEINDLIIDNEFFLNPKLSLSFLSKKNGRSEGYLSQLINTNSRKNFNDYVNELRIEHIKKLLIDDEYINYTISAIGLESGFNTKASF